MKGDKELISRFQVLKQIKPKKDWVVFAKRQMFDLGVNEAVKPVYKGIFSDVSSLFYGRKLAYSLAVFLFVFAGAFSFIKSVPQNQSARISENSSASLVSVKSNVDILRIKSENLAQARKDGSQNISLAVKEIKDATKSLTDAIQKNPKLAKKVALELKENGTLSDIDGGVDLKDLYKTIATQMDKDLDNVSLTPKQQENHFKAKDLISQERYNEATEKMLLIGRSDGNTDDKTDSKNNQ